MCTLRRSIAQRLFPQGFDVTQVGAPGFIGSCPLLLGPNIMAMLASIINGNIKAIGLICRDSPAPNTMRATMPSIAAIITTGSSSRTKRHRLRAHRLGTLRLDAAGGQWRRSIPQWHGQRLNDAGIPDPKHA